MDNEALVLKYQRGELGALDKLVENNENIVRKLANKFYIKKSNSIDIEDLIQEGHIGLIEAAKRYDFYNPKKAKFITYAVYWIYKKINRFIEQKNTNEEISLQTPVNDGEAELGDTIEDSKNHFEYVEKSLYYQEVRRALEEIMHEELTMMETNIIKLNFGWDGEELGIGEIAELYDNKINVVLSNKNRALSKIRKTRWAIQEWRIRKNEKSLI